MSQSDSSHPVLPGTVLGERYKVVSATVETADGDSILEGKDQVLNRRVSIVVASPKHRQRLITNARTIATNSRSTIQILDLGKTGGLTYLITSFSRTDALLDQLLTDSTALADSSETQEALGQEIFGDESAITAQTPYVSSEISAEEPLNTAKSSSACPSEQALETEAVVAEQENYEDYDEYDDYADEPDFDDEEKQSKGGIWIVAIAAIILLVLGVAVVFSSLNGMVSQDSNNSAQTKNSASSSASASGSSSASATPEATASDSHPAPAFSSVARLVPANPAYMADQDGTLPQIIDGNPSTTWASYGFGSANFGGIIDSFGLALGLKEQTVVSSLTITQVSGTGGSFTVYVNNSASLDGVTEVGNGTFTGANTIDVSLDTKKQGDGVKFIIIKFDEAPSLAQPIVAGYNYGVRIAEVRAK